MNSVAYEGVSTSFRIFENTTFFNYDLTIALQKGMILDRLIQNQISFQYEVRVSPQIKKRQ